MVEPVETTGDPPGWQIPPGLLGFAARGPDWTAWLDDLPRLAGSVLQDWGLTIDGPAMHGHCALVLPVRTAHRGHAVVKVAWPHDEEEHEHVALRRWHGDGAVRLLRSDPRRHALLLERLDPGRDLHRLEVTEACQVSAGLYRRIHLPAPWPLRPLTDYVARWTDNLARLPGCAPVPRALLQQAVSLGRDLVGDPDSVGRIIHGDLHYANVLAADREPWLLIDPKPMSGDPHYEPAPLLWNRWEEATADGDPARAVRRRLAVVVEVAGLDPQRARDWVVVRMLHNALWCCEDAAAQGRGLDATDSEWVQQCVRIAEAVQRP